jgi:hypothetical protein
MAEEYFRASSKKGRGRAKASLDLIEAMHSAAEAAQPITGRGIGYKLFAAGLIPSMARSEMAKVYRLLKEAREEGIIPWEWIVDETRELESVSSWKDPQSFMRSAARSYRRDAWRDQPFSVEVWSEKGTVRGVLGPVLDEYGVGFRVLHGFNSATGVHDVAQDGAGRILIALYVGDFDPSGMYMSRRDLPDRLAKYGGDHIIIKRIALLRSDLDDLSTFEASDKESDTRHDWFVKNYGDTCAELDAMDPNDLRDRVEESILDQIEPEAWERAAKVNRAEQESLRDFFKGWTGGAHG